MLDALRRAGEELEDRLEGVGAGGGSMTTIAIDGRSSRARRRRGQRAGAAAIPT